MMPHIYIRKGVLMMNKPFHNILRSVSVLPALLVMPAMADSYTLEPPFVDDYMISLSSQLHDVLSNQNTTGFEISKITVGTNVSSIAEHSFLYGINSNDSATQYVKVEKAGIPVGAGNMSIHIPAGSTYGLTASKLGMLAYAYGSHIEQSDGSAILTMADIAANTGNFIDQYGGYMGIYNTPWLINDMDQDLLNGNVANRYVYTDSNFVVDGQYGNMFGEFLASYEDSLVSGLNNLDYARLEEYLPDAVIRGLFGFYVTEMENLGDEGRAAAVHQHFQELTAGLTDLNSLKLKIGEVEVNGGSVTFINDVNITTSKLDIKNGANVIIDENSNTNINIADVDITYNGQYNTAIPITSTVNYTNDGIYVSGANTNVTVNNGAFLTVDGPKLDVVNGATLVNNGTLNVNTTNATFGEDITGTGALVIGENTILNIGTNSINQGSITLNGIMNATVREDDNAQFLTSTFDGNGILNLSFSGAGTYQVFGNAVFGEDGINVSGLNVNSSLYNINWVNEGKDLEATLKQVNNIATDNELSGDAAATLAGLAGSSSSVLNELAVTMQEKLAEGTSGAIHEVEQATSVINPGTESVSKTVANSVQNTVANLVGHRLALSGVGRSGGDSDNQSDGVWVQGLYNKTKMNDSFNGYTHGFAAGLDGKLNNSVTVGMGYAFNNSDVTTSSKDMDIDSHSFFVYGQYKPSGWFANTIMNYTWSKYTEKGYSSLVPMTNKYNTDSFGASLDGGYEFDFGLSLGMGLRYLRVDSEAYTDGFGIRKKFDAIDYLTPMFETKWGWDIAMSEHSSIRPEVRYALKYDVLCDATIATVSMPGAATYTLTGDRLPRVGNEFGLGLGVKSNALTVSVDYDFEFRPDYTSQTGMLKLRYEF